MAGVDVFDVNALRFSDIPCGSPTVVAGNRSPTLSVRPASVLGTSVFEDDSAEEDDDTQPLVDTELLLEGLDEPQKNTAIDALDELLLDEETFNRLTGAIPSLQKPPDLQISDHSSAELIREIVPEAKLAPKLRRKAHLTLPARVNSDTGTPPLFVPAELYNKLLDIHATTLSTIHRKEAGLPELAQPQPLHIINSSSDIHAVPARGESRDGLSTKYTRAVSMVPTPIDTQRARRSHIQLPMPSPYPTRQPGSGLKEILSTSRSHDASFTVVRSSFLPLMVQPRAVSHRPRVTNMRMPAAQTADVSGLRASRLPSGKRRLYTITYDDALFAQHLKDQYHGFIGWTYRFFAARTLGRVLVSGPESRSADKDYGWLPQGESGLHPASRSVSVGTRGGHAAQATSRISSYDEAKLLRLLQNPKRGRGRFAWVGWARRIADVRHAANADNLLSTPCASRQPSATHARMCSGRYSAPPPSRNRSADLGLHTWPRDQRASSADLRRLGDEASPARKAGDLGGGREEEGEFEGLVFVLEWSVSRIVIFLILVVLLAVAAALLWIFFGPRTDAWSASGRLQESNMLTTDTTVSAVKGAGDRVGTGVALGICVLLLGLTVFAGWLGVSWVAI